MDTHRVYATVLESLAQYRLAIEQYLKAAEINPNLTFLYAYIGRNYLRLRVYDRALEYFAKAADINEQLGVRNPIPYLEIAKTYTQQGEFFIASRNAEKALSYRPHQPQHLRAAGYHIYQVAQLRGRLACPALLREGLHRG